MSDVDICDTRILIVDDTFTNLDVLRRALEPKGHEIQVATNGETALKILSATPLPDLVLLDVMMPGMDGYEVCRKMKAEELTRDIPVIFLTAKNQPEDIVKGFSLGGVDYITKPFNHEEVYARIQTHLKLQCLKKELESKNEKLEALNNMKNKFLGMAAHDLRNPLVSIRGFSEILAEDIDVLTKEERDEYLGILYSASDHMLNLVNELLDVSVIESGKLQLNFRNGSLKTLVEERIRLYEVVSGKKNITLQPKLADVPDFEFDCTRVSQVLDNLITNAVKYSPAGTTVYIDLEEDEDFATVRVRDEGPGISEDDQGKLFQHFQKLSSQPTGNEFSNGLGLAIAKKLVECHSGSLQVDSVFGEGAMFAFKLPKKPVAP